MKMSTCSQKFDREDEIKCWNRRPKKRFEFGYEVDPTTQQVQVSPRNTSLSCISALTFDDSMHLINDRLKERDSTSSSSENKCYDESNRKEDLEEPFLISQQCDGLQNLKLENKSNTIDRARVEQKCYSQQDVGLKGSLYSRITNGYIENLQEEDKRKEVTIIDETLRTPILNDSKGEEIEMGYDRCDDGYTAGHTELIVEEEESYSETTADSSDTKSLQGNEDGQIRLYKGNNSTVADINNQPCGPLETTRDQWREVNDDTTGKTYFYNRRTRESRWNLPPDAKLMSKKRKINQKCNASIDCSSLKEVSVSSTDTNQRGEDKQNKMLHIQNNTVAVEKVCNGDTSIFDEDKKESHVIIEKCRRLRKSPKSEQRRRFFFPDVCEESNDEETEKSYEESSIEGIQKTLFSRNKSGQETYFAYCMFCGLETRDSHILIEHLSADCPTLKMFSKKDEICHLMNNTISRVESMVSSCDDYKVNQCAIYDGEDGNKENIPNVSQEILPSNNLKGTSSSENSNKPAIFSNSDDEETIADCSFNCHTIGSGSNRHYIEEETSPILSTCPFCTKSFQGGSYLSKHLLRCNARRKSNKKRTMRNSFSKQDGSQRRKKSSVNIQSHLLTDGGRRLPGYPKVGADAFDLGKTI